MLEVFYAGALRVSEVVNLKLEDLKLELGYVLVRGKGDKERIVPLGRAAQEIVQEYLRDARPVLAAGKSSPFLFIARGARGITRQRVWQMVNAASAQVASRQPAHAAAQLRDAHGGERRRPAHRADHPRPRRHLDHTGVHAPGAGSAEQGVTSSIIRGARARGSEQRAHDASAAQPPSRKPSRSSFARCRSATPRRTPSRPIAPISRSSPNMSVRKAGATSITS